MSAYPHWFLLEKPVAHCWIGLRNSHTIGTTSHGSPQSRASPLLFSLCSPSPFVPDAHPGCAFYLNAQYSGPQPIPL